MKRPVRIAVIGDTQHYRDDAGRLCALEPVVAQLDRWAELVDELVLCAPIDPGPPPVGFAPYSAPNVRLEPLPRAGGNSLKAKLGMLPLLVPWAVRTRRVARSVDGIHLRCPCNIGLVAIFSTWRATPNRYALYAGVWCGYEGEPRFYRLQRLLLGHRRFGGPVSVYASRDPEHPHLEPFFSPSQDDTQWLAAAPAAAATTERILDPTTAPWRAVVVGRLTENKNQQAAVRGVAEARARGVDIELEVIGDGPCRPELETLARTLDVADHVRFRGSLDHGDVLAAFATADLHLLTTRQEGFGKVLLEGMTFGTVPVFGSSPVAEEVSGGGSRGVVIDADDAPAIAAAIAALVEDRERWAAMAADARAYARTVTLEAFQDRVVDVLDRHWDIDLHRPTRPEAGR